MKALSYDSIKDRKKQLLSLVGFTRDEFEMLAEEFRVVWVKYITRYTLEGKPRKRSVAKERTNGILPTVEDKLLFILYEHKNYTIQGTMGAQFNMEQPHVSFWLKLLRPILQETLQNGKDLPVRYVVELNNAIAGRDKVAIDGVERPVLRSSDSETQKEEYSGKKKTVHKKHYRGRNGHESFIPE